MTLTYDRPDHRRRAARRGRPRFARGGRPRFAWWAPAAGLGAGVALGVIARLWMRWITTDPAFSWAGTIFIVAAFALFGLAQASAWAARRAGWRRPAVTTARAIAVVLSLPLFTGAGSIMLPTVAAAALAVWRRDWSRPIRAVAAVLSLPIALFIAREIGGEMGWDLVTVGRILTFLAIYATVVVAFQPSVAPLADGWRVPRWIRVAAVVLAAGVALLIGASIVGVP
jgi:hypothetical protein